MSMQWLEQSLRETGDPKDRRLANHIGRLLGRRGADVPLPGAAQKAGRLTVSPDFLTVLATKENAILEGSVEAHAQAQQRSIALQHLIEARTETLPTLFNEHLPRKRRSAPTSWEYTERRAKLNYRFGFHMQTEKSPIAPNRQSVSELALFFNTQQTKYYSPSTYSDLRLYRGPEGSILPLAQQEKVDSPLLALSFTNARLSKMTFIWHGATAGASARPLSNGSLTNFLDTFTSRDVARMDSEDKDRCIGAVSFTFGPEPAVSILHHTDAYRARNQFVPHGVTAIEFVYDSYENVFKRYDENPGLIAARNISDKSTLSVPEYDALLTDTLGLIPTRTLEF